MCNAIANSRDYCNLTEQQTTEAAAKLIRKK